MVPETPPIERVAHAAYVAACRRDRTEPVEWQELPMLERVRWIEVADACVATWLFIQAGLVLPYVRNQP